MALANFFDKIALGASQLLKAFNRSEFEGLLMNEKIAISYDENAATNSEGRATLDLLVRLLARLYPHVYIKNIENDGFEQELTDLAKSINPDIDLSAVENPTICVIVGKTHSKYGAINFYVGSDNWTTKFSQNNPVGSADSSNPFAAGAAACFGAANIFRAVFKEQLLYSTLDSDFSLSMLDFSLSPSDNGPFLNKIDIGETVLVGLGAIGNGAVWALAQLKHITGRLICIDHETIALSNLQRYVLATQDDIDAPKTLLVAKQLFGSDLVVCLEQSTWEEYLDKTKNWELETVAVGVDNAEDRIMVQGALPKRVFNAWTQQENIGVSRHSNFADKACLCCLYLPDGPKRSYSEEIAHSLNLGNQELLIRGYLANHQVIDQALLIMIAAANNISFDEISGFVGKSLEIFYAEAVCGGILMRLNDNATESYASQNEVPSAFESALAGILLAVEITVNKSSYRVTELPTRSTFNLIRGMSKYINESENKKTSCICNDPIYQAVYRNKWQ